MKETNAPKNAAANNDISALYNLMLDEDLEELGIKDGDTSVHILRKNANSAPFPYAHHAVGAPHNAVADTRSQGNAAEPPPAVPGDTIKSPIIGVFYRSSSPGAAPFVGEGDVVSAGKTLCIVEAMKVMNEIKAECKVKILKILVENGKPLTAGQGLFQVEKQ